MWQIPEEPLARSIHGLSVQPNIPINGDWGNEKFEDEMLSRYLRSSEEGLKEVRPHRLKESPESVISKVIGGKVYLDGPSPSRTLVIWPESPMNFRYEHDEKLKKRLAEFTKRNNVYLLINSWGAAKEGDAQDATYNSAMLIGPSGELINRYDKLALMPFGEYVPARGWIPFMDKIPALVGDVTAGKDYQLGEVADAKIGTMICFEVTRPDLARRFRNDGASVLVQLSNESWFGPTPAARQLLAQAVFRAVENNVDLLRVTNSGASAQITRYGDVLDETLMFETTTLTWAASTVEDMRNSPATFYTRHGDLFAIACTILSAMLVIAAVVYERMKKEDEEE
jgi:apolipoprotein N-acyltransferase